MTSSWRLPWLPKAQYLVTGDKDLRDIGEYKGVKIGFPPEFLAEIGG